MWHQGRSKRIARKPLRPLTPWRRYNSMRRLEICLLLSLALHAVGVVYKTVSSGLMYAPTNSPTVSAELSEVLKKQGLHDAVAGLQVEGITTMERLSVITEADIDAMVDKSRFYRGTGSLLKSKLGALQQHQSQQALAAEFKTEQESGAKSEIGKIGTKSGHRKGRKWPKPSNGKKVARHQDDLSNSTLIHAVLNKRTDKVKRLLVAGGSPHATRADGVTALMLASKGGDVELVSALLRYGADVDHQSKDGGTPLQWAAVANQSSVVDLLMEKGANVDLADQNGAIALHTASLNGRTQVVNKLLQRTKNVNKRQRNGDTALMWASMSDKADVVETLLAGGAEVDVQNNLGTTALMLASERCHPEVVAKLLLQGASLTLQNKDGETAAAVAKKKECSKVIAMLEGQAPTRPSSASHSSAPGHDASPTTQADSKRPTGRASTSCPANMLAALGWALGLTAATLLRRP